MAAPPCAYRWRCATSRPCVSKMLASAVSPATATSTCSSSANIFSDDRGGASSLLAIFFSAAITTPSAHSTATLPVLLPIAPMAYSTWYKRPSGEKVAAVGGGEGARGAARGAAVAGDARRREGARERERERRAGTRVAVAPSQRTRAAVIPARHGDKHGHRQKAHGHTAARNEGEGALQACGANARANMLCILLRRAAQRLRRRLAAPLATTTPGHVHAS